MMTQPHGHFTMFLLPYTPLQFPLGHTRVRHQAGIFSPIQSLALVVGTFIVLCSSYHRPSLLLFTYPILTNT